MYIVDGRKVGSASPPLMIHSEQAYLCADSCEALHPEVFSGGGWLQGILKLWRWLNINIYSALKERVNECIHTHTHWSQDVHRYTAFDQGW